jgi:hypothetical protein
MSSAPLNRVAFKRAHLKCAHAGSKMDVADIIACFVYGLNLKVYELYIKAFNAHPMAVPDILGAVSIGLFTERYRGESLAVQGA